MTNNFHNLQKQQNQQNQNKFKRTNNWIIPKIIRKEITYHLIRIRPSIKLEKVTKKTCI